MGGSSDGRDSTLERESCARCRLSAMTAHGDEGLIVSGCLAAGMDEYLTKPLGPRHLCCSSRSWLAGPARRRRFRAAGGISLQWLSRVAAIATPRGDQPLFVDDAPRHLDRIRKALDAHDGEALLRAAHGLKGAAANFDAEGVVAVARKLEEIGRTRQFVPPDVSESAWRSLSAEIERLISVLKALST